MARSFVDAEFPYGGKLAVAEYHPWSAEDLTLSADASQPEAQPPVCRRRRPAPAGGNASWVTPDSNDHCTGPSARHARPKRTGLR